MSRGVRQSQAWLHTWSGLLLGWVLYAMFLTGTSAYWRDELTRWMTPELGAPVEGRMAARRALDWLGTHATGAESWTLQLPGPRNAGTQVSWRMPGQSFREAFANRTWLDDAGEAVDVRETRGGDFFYRLHFDMHYMPVVWGRWLAGIAAMCMLVAIVSGVITHRKIFADFFTFRRGKGQRSWLDGHNALAVLALPFHLMITYTGLVTLMTLYMPFAVDTRYPDVQAFYADLFPAAPAVEASGTRAPLGDIEPMLVRAVADWGHGRVGTVRIEHPGDAAAQIVIARTVDARILYREQAIAFAGTDGRIIWRSPEPDAAARTRGGMVGLHAARFAPMTMRWLFFLASLAGTLMVASGLVLWTVKRRAQLPDPARPHLGFRVVESLNIGFVAGLPVAMAGYLWANRLLPTDMAERGAWEIHLFFLVWLACLLHGCARRPVAAWREQLAAGAVLFAALPVYNAMATSHGVFASLAAGDVPMATMESCLLGLGVLLAWMSWAVDRHARRPPVRTARRARAAVAPT